MEGTFVAETTELAHLDYTKFNKYGIKASAIAISILLAIAAAVIINASTINTFIAATDITMFRFITI